MVRRMLESYGITETGLVRKVNEDSIFCGSLPFFILADGMGGYKGGQTASISAVRAAKQYLENLPPEDFSEEELRGAAMQANLDILMQKEKNKEFQNMGTTLLLSACAGDTLYWAHVGDSRIYAARGGTLTQVTTDHSVVMDLLREGKITKEEMIGHPRKNEITRAVGIHRRLEVDTGHIELEEGALILMCSDGLSMTVSESFIQSAILSCGPGRDGLKNCVESLVKEVYEAGAPDNISAILIRYSAEEKE